MTSSRTYKNPEPLVAINHLCGLDEYISQPRSCRLSFIIPGTCAPSTAEKIPFDRASSHNCFAGSTTPENVVIWLKKITFVCDVMASLKRFSTCAASFTGRG